MSKLRRGWQAITLVVLLGGCSSSGSWVAQQVPGGELMMPYTLWVFGENDVWLGGSSIWHFDGKAWTETAPPGSTPIVKFWGFAPDDLWAIGDSVALHWDGTTWRDRSAADGTGFNALSAIWGQSSADLWIANGDNSRVFHFDGTKWTRTVLQFVAANALWGSSSADIWLVGTFDPYHYDGTTWTAYDANDDAPRHATGLWGSGPTDVWAAGGSDELAHWDGSTWTGLRDTDGSYNAIWGAAANHIYAVGSFGFFARYDGTSWTESQPLGMSSSFTMIHGSSSTNVWAAGINQAERSSFVMRYVP